MWTCSNCGRQYEEAFDSCWKCGAPAALADHPALTELNRLPDTPFTLSDYLTLVRSVPLPTPEQRVNFVEYVTSAHSWYKHLPAFQPGEPFYFFLDLFAGCDRVVFPDGSTAFLERTERGDHYADIPTRDYRERFGFLNYSCAAGTAVVRLGAGPSAVPRDKVVAAPDKDGRMRFLPEEILKAGRTRLTAMIHPLSPSYSHWDGRGKRNAQDTYWPEESGGQAALQRIFERCAEMRQPAYSQEREERTARAPKEHAPSTDVIAAWNRTMADPVLYELIEPERRRQKAKMLKAIDRVCQLVESAHQLPD